MKYIRMKNLEKGFVLLDAVFALFIFTLGFASLYGLTIGASNKTQQAINLTKASNLAITKMEALSVEPTIGNLSAQGCIPGESISGKEGRFSWTINPTWEVEDQLLQIQVLVTWQEKNNTQTYTLETLLKVT